MARTCRWGVVRVIGGELHLQEADAVITPITVFLEERDLTPKSTKQRVMNYPNFVGMLASSRRKLNLPPCPVTTNVVSEPYNLENKFKHIIHVVSPDCRRPNQDESRRDLLPYKHTTTCLTLFVK